MAGASDRNHPPLPQTAVLREEYFALREGGLLPPNPPSALCLSGGGIRSASFCVGIIQGLARTGLLGGFDYLSTVSGGGFAGGWLVAWIQRHPQGLAGVTTELAAVPDPQPIHFIRSNSSYLAPAPGLQTSSSLAFGAVYLHKVLLNWLVFLPLLLGLPLLPQMLIADIRHIATSQDDLSLPFISGFVSGHLVRLVVALVLMIRPAGYVLSRENLPSGQQGPLGLASFMMWMVISSVATAYAWVRFYESPPGILVFMSVAVGAYILGGLYFALRFRASKGLTWRLAASFPAGMCEGLILSWGATRLLPNPVGQSELYACAAVPFLFSVRFVGGTVFMWLGPREGRTDFSWWYIARIWLLLLSGAWAGISVLVVLGPKFVMRLPAAMQLGIIVAGALSCVLFAVLAYRSAVVVRRRYGVLRRLARDVLLGLSASVAVVYVVTIHAVAVVVMLAWIPSVRASVWDGGPPNIDLLIGLLVAVGVPFLAGLRIDVNRLSLHTMYRNSLIKTFLGASRTERDRTPDPLTGLDADDDLAMVKLPKRPLIVVNMAVTVGPEKFSETSRRGTESYTVTPLHVGNRSLKYRSPKEYGGGITLGTAMAVSGAAISPNAGRETPPHVRFLGSILNIGMGVWLGNPSASGGEWQKSRPRHAGLHLLRIALARPSDQERFVHLSDGGHFENLGLYEMVRRRCSPIVVIDAGCDPKYGCNDLANAIQKIRTDFGIEIEAVVPFDKSGWQKGGRYAKAVIRYSEADPARTDGIVVFVKPVILGNEPVDVVNYAEVNPEFPHQSTTDQWFDEAQFESHRALGLHTAKDLSKVLSQLAGETVTSPPPPAAPTYSPKP